MFTASFCPLLTAQNEKDSIESTPLTEVVATAKEQKEIISAQKLSGQELDALNSFSVADAIRYFSGVQLKDYGGVGGLKTINIRSMGTNQVYSTTVSNWETPRTGRWIWENFRWTISKRFPCTTGNEAKFSSRHAISVLQAVSTYNPVSLILQATRIPISKRT